MAYTLMYNKIIYNDFTYIDESDNSDENLLIRNVLPPVIKTVGIMETGNNGQLLR